MFGQAPNIEQAPNKSCNGRLLEKQCSRNRNASWRALSTKSSIHEIMCAGALEVSKTHRLTRNSSIYKPILFENTRLFLLII